MHITHIFVVLALLISCAFSSSALAESLSVKKSAQGMLYVTGGISEDEADTLAAYQKKFSVRFVFSEGISGRAATPVNANIYGTNDQLVFRIVEAQPQLLVNLPAGTYTILARYNGELLRHKFTLAPNAHKKIVLNWKNLVDEDMLDEETAVTSEENEKQ